MNCKLKRKDLVLIKWNSKYMTDREGAVYQKMLDT